MPDVDLALINHSSYVQAHGVPLQLVGRPVRAELLAHFFWWTGKLGRTWKETDESSIGLGKF